jgi:hypothetical protein
MDAFLALFGVVDHLVVVLLMFYLLHDRLKTLSPGSRPDRLRRLRWIYFLLLFIYFVLVTTDVVMWFIRVAAIMDDCTDCEIHWQIRGILVIAADALYAAFSIYWLGFAIVLLKMGRRKQVASSVSTTFLI